MTTARTTPARRSSTLVRRAAVALVAAAGVALTPLPAQAAQQSSGSLASVIAEQATNRQAEVAVWAALAQQGKPYAWGAAGPNAFDCSGLIQFAMKRVGVSLPHSSRAMSQRGYPVSKSNLRPGDLVFFYSPVSHVAMYVGNGKVVHSPNSGSVVHVTDMDTMPFTTARRVV